MSNEHRGEAELVLGDRTFLLRLTTNAMVQVEEKAGRSFVAMVEELSDPMRARLGTVRTALWGALLEHHPDITLEMVGDMMDGPDMPKCGQALGRCLDLAFPHAKTNAPKKTKGPARKRRQ